MEKEESVIKEKKSKYISMSEDLSELWHNKKGKRIKSAGKLLLKSVANIGIYAVTDFPKDFINHVEKQKMK